MKPAHQLRAPLALLVLIFALAASPAASTESIRRTVIAEGFGADGVDIIATQALKETIGGAIDEEYGTGEARVDINIIQSTTDPKGTELDLEIHPLDDVVAQAVAPCSPVMEHGLLSKKAEENYQQ